MKNNLTVRNNYNKLQFKKKMAGWAAFGLAGSMNGDGPWQASL